MSFSWSAVNRCRYRLGTTARLIAAILDHHAAGFIYRSPDDTPADKALACWPPRSSRRPRSHHPRIAHLVQAQAQLGEPPDAGQSDRVPQRVLAVAVRLARGLGQQADAVVMPDGPGADDDEAGEFSDPHAFRKHLDAASRST